MIYILSGSFLSLDITNLFRVQILNLWRVEILILRWVYILILLRDHIRVSNKLRIHFV